MTRGPEGANLAVVEGAFACLHLGEIERESERGEPGSDLVVQFTSEASPFISDRLAGDRLEEQDVREGDGGRFGDVA